MYKYVNEYGDTAIIDYYSGEYILVGIEGADSVECDIKSVKGMFQDGSCITSKTINDRSISITGMYKASNSLKENIIRVFNPKCKGVLYYSNNNVTRKIKCEIESSPIFTVGSYLHEFRVGLLCNNVYWEDVNETEVLFSSIRPMLEFPVSFNGEFEISRIDNETIKDIENNGDVDSPIEIKFLATGTVVNPWIQSSNLEVLKLNLTLNEGDKILITTGYGNKKVTIVRVNGDEEKGFKYLDYASVFMQLPKGVTRFTYGADQYSNNLAISFKFTKRYIGVI